ncbi:MAG: class I SAM-dependent methyltransferase [Actinomycetota bacterium]
MSSAPRANNAAAADRYVPSGSVERLLRSAKERGVARTVIDVAEWGLRLIGGPRLARYARQNETFTLSGIEFPYFYSWDNWTWLNERTVEIPIALAALADNARVLEVGAVMPHYTAVNHRVIDKYEDGPGIEQADILDLHPDQQYDLVLSISTVEHVGWDETPRDPGKALLAIERLKDFVAPGGELLVTLPVGYHPPLEAALQTNAETFTSVEALRCSRRSRTWSQVTPDSAAGVSYDFLTYSAAAVLICRWRRAKG